MSLRIYNTLSRALEDFSPLEPGHVRMYVCGMTIYDLCHIGHARMMMAFDVVQRWLKASGMRVTFVRNITDIDDKIIKRALERGITIRQLTDEMIAAMHQDIGALGIEPPSVEPRATEYVPQMLSLIGQPFKKAIIAAGSQAVRLPFMPDDPRVVDSTGALALKSVPRKMLILGGGIIGLEMGTVYSTLGARLDVVEMLDGLMQGADRDLVKAVN